MTDDPDDTALSAALTIELLLDTCRDGKFYEDHDESLAMLYDAYEALDTLTHAATTIPTEDTSVNYVVGTGGTGAVTMTSNNIFNFRSP